MTTLPTFSMVYAVDLEGNTFRFYGSPVTQRLRGIMPAKKSLSVAVQT